MDAEHFDTRSVSANDLDIGLRYAKRLGEKLPQRFVCSPIDGRRCESNLEGTILNADDAISAGTRGDSHLEGDRAVLFPNA